MAHEPSDFDWPEGWVKPEQPQVPKHLRPSSCFICGDDPHPETGHFFWSNADALAEAREHDRQVVLARTPEAAYVAEHRPY